MAWKQSYLVIANVTADAVELRDAMQALAAAGQARFTLVVPAAYGGSHEHSEETLARALEGLREAGLEVEGEVGSVDPLIAVSEAWDPKQFDAIIVSTLPLRFSKWLRAGLPERIARISGAPVTHVISKPPMPPPVASDLPAHEQRSLVLGALSFMRLEP